MEEREVSDSEQAPAASPSVRMYCCSARRWAVRGKTASRWPPGAFARWQRLCRLSLQRRCDFERKAGRLVRCALSGGGGAITGTTLGSSASLRPLVVGCFVPKSGFSFFLPYVLLLTLFLTPEVVSCREQRGSVWLKNSCAPWQLFLCADSISPSVGDVDETRDSLKIASINVGVASTAVGALGRSLRPKMVSSVTLVTSRAKIEFDGGWRGVRLVLRSPSDARHPGTASACVPYMHTLTEFQHNKAFPPLLLL